MWVFSGYQRHLQEITLVSLMFMKYARFSLAYVVYMFLTSGGVSSLVFILF